LDLEDMLRFWATYSEYGTYELHLWWAGETASYGRSFVLIRKRKFFLFLLPPGEIGTPHPENPRG
jgi:hypothetical protein